MLRRLLPALVLFNLVFAVKVAAEVPKVAVVITGDPDQALQRAAHDLEDALVESGLTIPTDPALRDALRGVSSGDRPDGLDGLRAQRRALGLDPRKDTEALARIGLIAGAHALVVVRKERAGPIAEVFDVGVMRFYEDTLVLESANTAAHVDFVARRANAALRRSQGPPTDTSEPIPAASTDPAPLADKPHKKRWIKKNWPYILAGALLAGTITYFVVDSQRGGNDPRSPVLRFRPGVSQASLRVGRRGAPVGGRLPH